MEYEPTADAAGKGRSCCQSKIISCGEALRRAEAMGSCVATNLSCRLMGFTRWVKYAFGGWYRSLQHAVEQARRLDMAKITVNLGWMTSLRLLHIGSYRT